MPIGLHAWWAGFIRAGMALFGSSAHSFYLVDYLVPAVCLRKGAGEAAYIANIVKRFSSCRADDYRLCGTGSVRLGLDHRACHWNDYRGAFVPSRAQAFGVR